MRVHRRILALMITLMLIDPWIERGEARPIASPAARAAGDHPAAPVVDAPPISR